MLLMGKSTISMAIFNSYVKLPEGRLDWFRMVQDGLGLIWAKLNHQTSSLGPWSMMKDVDGL